MIRKFLLVTLIIAASISVAASADTISKWNFASATRSAETTIPEPGTYPMYLAALGLMGLIARRRTR